MRSRNRGRALAVAIAALWIAGQASGEERDNALWQLPEDERYFLLHLAGGDDMGENQRPGHFRTSAEKPISLGICRHYFGPESWDDPEMKKYCLEELPPLMLERMHQYGYKEVKLEDVADVQTFTFFSKTEDKIKSSTPEHTKFLEGYLKYKKRLGVYTAGDYYMEVILKGRKRRAR